MLYVAGSPRRASSRTEGLDLTDRELTHVSGMRTVSTKQEQAIARYQVHEPAERQADRIQVGINIGVIELDVVDDGDVGQVFEKLRTLVEECAVVLVAFDDEVTAAADAI